MGTMVNEGATLGELLTGTAARRPDHEALVVDDERLTYAELLDRARTVARGLAALGVGRGDHVGLLMPNCPDMVAAFFGVQLLGAVAVPLNTRYRTRELRHVVSSAELRVILTSDVVDDHVDLVARLDDALPGLADTRAPTELRLDGFPRLGAVVLLGSSRPDGLVARADFEGLAAGHPASTLPDPGQATAGDVAMLLFTSGTTSQPKACCLTHAAVIHVWTTVAETLRITEDDRIWDPLPMFHMSCLGPLVFSVALGATLISTVHFEPGAGLRQIAGERASWLYSVFPPIAMGLVKHPEFARTDRSAVRGLLNVAPPETLRLLQEAFAPAVQVGGHFGMTECAGAITCNAWDATLEARVETCGPPIRGVEVRVVDPDAGDELGPGRRGELQIRGAGLFAGYYRDPEGTEAVFAEGGWLRSGDEGAIDETGAVIYTGRLKDMLKIGGENVAPSEIEAHLSTHPAVKLVQVVGMPDPRLDEVPVAFVELVDGQTASPDDLIAHCVGEIAGFKVPRRVHVVTEWPMSATKIQKFRLREMLSELG